jgi:hypothetical protein
MIGLRTPDASAAELVADMGLNLSLECVDVTAASYLRLIKTEELKGRDDDGY